MWAIEVMIMPLFLIMAGYLAARSMATKGPSTTFRSRLRRLGIPLLLCVMFLIPTELYVWLTGWLAEGLIEPRKLRTLKFHDGIDQHLWGLSHLWFLQYLITYVAVLAVSWNRVSRLSRAQSKRLTWITLLATIAVLAWQPEVVWGFQHAFLPVPAKWLYSGLCFAGGVLCWHQDPSLLRLRQVSPRWLAPSMMLWVASVAFGIWWLNQSYAHSATPFQSWPETIVSTSLALLTTLAAASVSLTLIGVALARIKRIDRVTASLAAASFWIYLLHHPVVGLSHIALKFGLPGMNSSVKWLSAATLGLGIAWSLHWLATMRSDRIAATGSSTSLEPDHAILPLERPSLDDYDDLRRAG